MSTEDVERGFTRRDLLRILAGVAAANGLGAATWGALEALVPAGSADTWHKSVCHFAARAAVCSSKCAMAAWRVPIQDYLIAVVQNLQFLIATLGQNESGTCSRHGEWFAHLETS